MSLQEKFQQAATDSKKLTSKPSNEELLELYGLYKVANGEDFSSAEKPGRFDLKSKYKYQSWEKFVQEGLTAEAAQQRYVDLVEKLKESCGFDPNKTPEAVGK